MRLAARVWVFGCGSVIWRVTIPRHVTCLFAGAGYVWC